MTDRQLSTKVNKAFKIKSLIKGLEAELKPLLDEIKDEVIHENRKDDKGNFVYESGSGIRTCITTTIKVSDLAVPYLKEKKRDDLIITKEYTTADKLGQVMGEEAMTREGLASYIYSVRLTEKK